MKLPTPPGGGLLWVYDLEIFQNYFCVWFTNGHTWKFFDHTQFQELRDAINNKDLVLAGFNNFGYDDLILRIICQKPDVTTLDLYHASKDIIFGNKKGDLKSERIFQLQWSDTPWRHSIDVFQLLNARGSLKEWECRIGLGLVAESPVDFDQPLPNDRIAEVVKYCRNDVEATKALLVKHWDRVVLRETLQKQFDLMSKVYCLSEQGVAQHTFLTLHRKRTGEKSADVRLKAKENPENQAVEWPLASLLSTKVSYVTPEFQAFFEGFKTGRATADEKDNWHLSVTPVVRLAGRDFSIGVGGIHTVDAPGIFESTDEHAIIDLDVASYYPSLIIEENLYPKHIGPGFVEDMRILRDKRLAAKRIGDKKTADALKIVINATFGKLNDKYSPLRSVPDAMRVTLNGQLFILMLVESLKEAGCEIISANTDGVTVLLNRNLRSDLDSVVRSWQLATHMVLEEVEYSRIFRRDINNYLAITVDGKIKYKGAISTEGGKGDGAIIRKAAERFLLDGVPPEVTVDDETDPKAFLFYMRSKAQGEIHYEDEKIGKSARWYICDFEHGKPLRRWYKETQKAKAGWRNIPNSYSDDKKFKYSSALALDVTTWTMKDMKNINLDFYVKEAWALIESMGPQ